MAASLAELVDERRGSDSGTPVLTFVDIRSDGSHVVATRTYSDLKQRAAVLAGQLAALGVSKGDRFAIMMNNHPQFIDAMVAASMLGAVFVPVDPRCIGAKLFHILARSECVGAFVGDYCVPALRSVSDQCAALRWAFQVADAKMQPLPLDKRPDAIWHTHPRSDLESPARPDAADPMFVMFTSGTTGNPKGVVQSHGEYIAASAKCPIELQPADRFSRVYP